MNEYLLTFFGKPSWSDPRGWLVERIDRFKKRPVSETVKYLLILPVVLYLLAQLWPFITDLPYLIVFLLTLSPFIIFSNLRQDAQKSMTLTLLVVTLLYFWAIKPLAFPPDPDSLLFSEKFFKFENYKYFPDAYTVIPKIFPAGTPKERVEEILVNRGRAKGGGWKNVKYPEHFWISL